MSFLQHEMGSLSSVRGILKNMYPTMHYFGIHRHTVMTETMSVSGNSSFELHCGHVVYMYYSTVRLHTAVLLTKAVVINEINILRC